MQIEAISISQALEPNAHGEPQYLSDLLYFPEIATFNAAPEKSFSAQLKVAEDLLKTRPPEEVQRRQPGAQVIPAKVSVRVGPPNGQKTVVWSEPVTLDLPYVHWLHGSGVAIAYVPCLGIEVVAADEQALQNRIVPEVGEAILREGFSNSLLDLAYLDRGREIEVHTRDWMLTPRSPVDEYRASQGEEKDSEAVLDEVATRLEPRKMDPAFGMDSLVATLGSLVGGKRKHSVLLVGPAGVGKTALLHELVRTKRTHRLGARQFYRTSGSRLVAGMCGFGMWQERCRKVVAEAGEKRAILHLGSLLELVEVGQSTASQESIASFLRPYLMRGQLTAILECTPEQLAVIEKREPKLLDAFRQLPVPEPENAVADSILHSVYGETFSAEAIDRAASLHRRYSSYSAFPGRPLRFLSRAAVAAETLDTAAVLDAFSRESGMPPVLLSDDYPLDLAEAEAWFSKRVAGQPRAVGLVTDTLATIKTELNRPGKPLASFFFIGPTGVGKTELAKRLSAYLFGSPERMLRLDMSEYGTPGSASRLVSESGIGGKEGLLTSKIREQPFSVLLLDEFEKAHPTVFDLFLQVLGEARLTDGAGRVAEFTNTVIIMTSNLGAREFQRGSMGFAGGNGGGSDAVAHFTGAVKNALRPELFNRIDRIVPFDPLPLHVIEKILRREIASAAARDGLAGRGVKLHISEKVVGHITKLGHDPRYGARPLKRALERHVLAPAAERLASVSLRDATLKVDLDADENVTFSLKATAVEQDVSADNLAFRYFETSGLRRNLQKVATSPPVATLSAERSRLTVKLAKKNSAADRKRLAMIDALFGELEKATDTIRNHEEALLLAIADESKVASKTFGHTEFEDLLTRFHQATTSAYPPTCTLLVLADTPETLAMVANAYFSAAVSLKAEPKLFTFGSRQRIPDPGKPASPYELDQVDPEKVRTTLAAPRPDAPAFGISLSSPAAAFFAGEIGVLQFTGEGGKRSRAFVTFTPHPPEKIAVPPSSLRKPDYQSAPVRRRFDLGRPTYFDALLKKRGRTYFTSDLLVTLLREANSESIRKEFLGE